MFNRTNSTIPTAFHAQTLVGELAAALPVIDLLPPSNPPSPSIILRATTSTKSQSCSSAKPLASLAAASASLGSSSKAF